MIKDVFIGAIGVFLVLLPMLISNLVAIYYPNVNSAIPPFVWMFLGFPCGAIAGQLFYNIYKRRREVI